jgi:hypothetical protein
MIGICDELRPAQPERQDRNVREQGGGGGGM